MKNYSGILFAIFFSVMLTSPSCKCKKDKPEENAPVVEEPETINPSTTVRGYGILAHLPGIWNGPVVSSTMLGSYPEWIVDFRPVSAAQVSAKNELDSLNNILMSFFIVKHGGEYKMAFRNGGGFAGSNRIAYAVVDSVSESPNQSFYRFSDFRAGKNRLYTNVEFKTDSMIIHVYTNVYNSLSAPVSHMMWRAKLQDASSASNAIAHFSFPQKQEVKDFSTTFDAKPEAIYYDNDLANDPYNAAAQPYLGKTTINISYDAAHTPDPAKKVFLMITTQSLFSGFSYIPANLKYRSRYVFLAASDTQFTFDYMHPGTYYLYSFYDTNGDGMYSSGDWTSSNLSNSFTLGDRGTQTANTQINFTIP
ncbi:MAG: hypothetical protein K0Q95_1782 [Bacteroidota bacterium]|jgi:hypothetical protein|nr:hypothetical protein [Bacteroidota bacterium]